MVAPVVAGLAVMAGIGGLASSIRGVHQGIETRRYWNDYKAKTGFSPRYPVRSGLYDTVYGAFGVGSSIAGLGVRGYAGYGSWMNNWQKPVNLDNGSYYA